MSISLLLRAVVLSVTFALLLAAAPSAKPEPARNAAEKSAKPQKGKGKKADKQQDAETKNARAEQEEGDTVEEQPANTAEKTDAVGPRQPSESNNAEQSAPAPSQSEPDPRVRPAGPPVPELPSIAQDQPGFIPDKSPEDLFNQPQGQTPRERYRSLLGPSRLPPEGSDVLIQQQAGTPAVNLEENQARVIVPDGSIEGSVAAKQFKIRGGVIIFYNDVEITAEEADIDEKGETAVLRDTVEIVDPNYNLKTNELRIFFGAKKFEALGFVQFTKNAKPDAGEPDLSLPKKDRLREHFSKQQFELYCNKLYYDWGAKTLTALQSVRLEHPSFAGTMERLDYNDKDKAYEMEGDVALNVAEYDWIFTNQLTDAKDEKKVRAVTDEPTKITADKVNYSDESAVAQFYAKSGKTVVFDQTKRKVTANYMEINDTTKDFYAEGGDTAPAVFDQSSGEWLIQSGMISEQDASAELKDMLQKPMTAKARTITFNYDRKRLEMRKQVEVVSEQRQLTAGEMIQDETAKFFLVKDNVFIKTDANTELRAAQVYVDTANDVYTFVGLVGGKAKGDALGLPSMDPNAPGAQPGITGGAAEPSRPVAAGVFQQQ